MSVLEQGEAYIKKKINKVERMFASKQEGFSGILGPNAEMEYVNQTDRAKTTASVNQLNNDINAYQSAATALQNRTNLYLKSNTSNGDTKRNYNVFINKSVAVTAISPVSALAGGAGAGAAAGASAAGGGAGAAGASAVEGAQCVSLASLDGFADSSNNGFDEAYPNNFTLFDDAKAACQTWAADLGFKFFGVSKQNDQYKCYTANNPPQTPPKNFTTPTPLYTVATKTDATRGGLFSNGQIGVYRSTKVEQWNIANMSPPVYIKHYNNATYSSSEPTPYAKAISDNWWGTSTVDWSPTPLPWGENVFPDDKTAWWIAYTSTATDNNNVYYYYVYKSAAAVTPPLPQQGSDCLGWTCPNQGERCLAAQSMSKNRNWVCTNNVWVPELTTTQPAGQYIGIYMVNPGHGTFGPFNLQVTGVLKINGVDIALTSDWNVLKQTAANNLPSKNGGYNGFHVLNLNTKYVFEVTGPKKSAIVMYVFDLLTKNILFRTGDPGWGVLPNPVPDWKMVTNIPKTAQTMADPYLFTTVNTEPNGFSTCDKLIGGNINTKTINATYGKNCSNSTKKPLNVRYIIIRPNGLSQNIQISQLVVMAFLNGVQQNVANKGKITSSPSINGTDPSTPVDGNTDNKLYWSSEGIQDAYWQLDLEVEFPIVSITFYNRPEHNYYADGMKINFQDGNNTAYTLKNPIVLTGQLIQTFNVSADDIYIASPTWLNAAPGFKVSTEGRKQPLWWYGINSMADAAQLCASRGQRMCRFDEVQNYDWGLANTVFSVFPDNRILLLNKHRLVGPDGFKSDAHPVDFGPLLPGNRAGVYCCDTDHIGAYDPVITPMTVSYTY